MLLAILTGPATLDLKSQDTFRACAQARMQADRGHSLLGRGAYGLAIDDLQSALKLCPSDSTAVFDLTQAYIKDGQFKPADRTARHFLASNPNSDYARYLLAFISFSQGRFQDARVGLEKTLRHQPHDVDSLRLMAATLISLKQYSSARGTLHEILELRHNDLDALNEIGATYIKEQDYSHALSIYQQMVRIHPEDYTAHNNLASVYVRIGRRKEALDEVRKAEELARKAGIIYDAPFANEASFLISGHQYAQALAPAQEAVRLNPRAPWNQFLLGQAYYHKGEPRAAIKCLRAAIQSDPHFAGPHHLLGTIYRELGRNEESTRELKAFGALRSQYPNSNPELPSVSQ